MIYTHTAEEWRERNRRIFGNSRRHHLDTLAVGEGIAYPAHNSRWSDRRSVIQAAAMRVVQKDRSRDFHVRAICCENGKLILLRRIA